MGTNTLIYLPHAPSEKIFEVVRKVVGHEFFKQTFENVYLQNGSKTTQSKEVDNDLPATKDNSWHIKFKTDINIKISSVNHFRFDFFDSAHNFHSIALFLDVEDDEHSELGDKKLYPSSSAFSCALGKRLVDFFGGKMFYADCLDKDDPTNWYLASSIKFPFKTKDQSSDDRWYQFHNALFNEPIISSSELLEMKEKSYWSRRDESLFQFLLKHEFKDKLEQALPSSDTLFAKRKI